MESRKLYCKCCGKEIKLCPHCPTESGYTPWRTLADSMDHYKAFMAACMYANKEISEEQAREHFEKLNISGYEKFDTQTGEIIRKVMKMDKPEVQESPVNNKTRRMKKAPISDS